MKDFISLIFPIVHAENSTTIHSYSQFKSYMQQGNGTFAQNLVKLINIGKNLGLILLGGAFFVAVLSLIVQAGKLGGANIMGPEFNAKRKQEAYEGILHACLHFALIGAAATIFSAIFGFFVGV